MDSIFTDSTLYLGDHNPPPFNNMKNLSSFKEYLKGSILTFISSFAVAFIPFLGGADFSHSAILAAILTAARLALKAVLESLAVIKPTKSA